MQHEVQALLRALLSEQERERRLYQSLLAAVSASSLSRKRMLEDIVTASRGALCDDDEPKEAPARVAQEALTEAIKRMSEARNRAIYDHPLN